MPKNSSTNDMRRAVYYASKGLRTAYASYDGISKELVKELLDKLDGLYIAIHREEYPQHD